MATLEERVAAIEERLGMESGLRASLDRDLADMKVSLRAANHLLQALALTQSQHTETLADHTARLDRLDTGVQQIIALLNTLIERG